MGPPKHAGSWALLICEMTVVSSGYLIRCLRAWKEKNPLRELKTVPGIYCLINMLVLRDATHSKDLT